MTDRRHTVSECATQPTGSIVDIAVRGGRIVSIDVRPQSEVMAGVKRTILAGVWCCRAWSMVTYTSTKASSATNGSPIGPVLRASACASV